MEISNAAFAAVGLAMLAIAMGALAGIYLSLIHI